MTDPGNPFLPGHDMVSVVAALQDSVLSGVEHEDFYRFVFDPAVAVYTVPREATSVSRVTGLSGGRFLEFTAGRDYDAGLSRIVWRDAGANDPGTPPRRPDTRTQVEVTYRFRDTPPGLTDVGPGSVTGTVLRAVAREIALLYQQVNEAYRRAFLDTASDAALDGVVALLGVTRNPEQAASGAVRFSRRADGLRIKVPERTVVEDAAGRRYRTTQEAVLDQGTLYADALVTAERPGPDGNNGPGMLTVLPTPVSGLAATNPDPVTGGLAAESDDALRERARHALERAGNATTGALEFAVRAVDGVEDVAVIDHTVDITVPLGEVRVRYSAGGDDQRQADIRTAVERVVETTRAAGIKAVAETVRAVTIAGRVVVAGAPGGDVASGVQDLSSALSAAINGTGIGAPLSLRKLSALAFQTPGLADVLMMSLTFTRDQPSPTLPGSGVVPDLLPVDHAEHVVAGQIGVVALDGLTVTAPGGPPQHAGDPVPVTLTPLHAGQSFDPPLTSVLQVRFEVRAAQLSLPSEPPVVVADVVKTAKFDNAVSADVQLTGDDLQGYDPGKHAPTATATVTLVGYAVPPATRVLVLR